MTPVEFKTVDRGDVLRWTGKGHAGIGLVRRVESDRIHVLWEDGLDGIYKQEDADRLEFGP